MKKQNFRYVACVLAFSLSVFGSLSAKNAQAETVTPAYVVWNATQIELDGRSFQIAGVLPVKGKAREGMEWLADTAEMKAQSRPKGADFSLIGCKEVLIGRYLCEDIHFSDGESVKQAVLKRRYAEKR